MVLYTDLFTEIPYSCCCYRGRHCEISKCAISRGAPSLTWQIDVMQILSMQFSMLRAVTNGERDDSLHPRKTKRLPQNWRKWYMNCAMRDGLSVRDWSPNPKRTEKWSQRRRGYLEFVTRKYIWFKPWRVKGLHSGRWNTVFLTKEWK